MWFLYHSSPRPSSAKNAKGIKTQKFAPPPRMGGAIANIGVIITAVARRSSEAKTDSHQENASKQKHGAFSRFHETRKRSGQGRLPLAGAGGPGLPAPSR
jgi:hypothetical protein